MFSKKTHSQKVLIAQAERQEERCLVEQVLSRDQKAWREFCRRYENLIVACTVKTLRRYHAKFNAEDLADIVGEVWMVLLKDEMRKLRLFDPARGYRLTSWLGLITTNCTIDQLRQRCRADLNFDDVSSLELTLADDPRPDQGLEEMESVKIARQAIGQLSSEEQRFVFSCFHEERRPEDLAQELGITVNTVYSRKFKIREKLTRIVAALAQELPAPAMAA